MNPDPGPADLNGGVRRVGTASAALFAGADWRRGARYLLTFLAVLVVFDALWIGVRGHEARARLEQVRNAVDAARVLAASDQLTDAQGVADAVRKDTQAARRDTSDPIWHLNGHLPIIGSSFQDVAALAQISDDITVHVLPELGTAVAAVQGNSAVGKDGAIDLTRFTAAAQGLPGAASSLQQSVNQLLALPPDPRLGAARSARDELLQVFQQLSGQIATASLAAQVGPDMLGAHGSRNYLLVLANPAELRGGGGIIGGFAYLRAENGKLAITGQGSDRDLRDFPRDVIALDPSFQRLYESSGVERSWRNANLSPDFPATAKILEAMSAASGRPVDGVISIDPDGVGSVLAATQSIITDDGTPLDSPADVSTYVEKTLYALYPRDPQDQPARKQELVALQQRVFNRAVHAGDAQALLSALAGAAGQGHLRLASSRPAEESVLAGTPLGGALTSSPGPFAGVALTNIIGNKTDAYLSDSFRWTAGACPSAAGGQRLSTQALTLHNATPQGLTSYVAGSSDPTLQNLARGTDRLKVAVYGGVGGQPVAATLDGRPVHLSEGSEQSHPVVVADLTLPPGGTRTLTVTFSEPASGQISAPMLPTTVPGPATISVPDCSS